MPTRQTAHRSIDVGIVFSRETERWADWIAGIIDRNGFSTTLVKCEPSDGLRKDRITDAKLELIISPPEPHQHGAIGTTETCQHADSAATTLPPLVQVLVESDGAAGAPPQLDLGALAPANAECLLLQAVTTQLGSHSQPLRPAQRVQTSPEYPGHLPAVWSAPPRNRLFSGRNEILTSVAKRLGENCSSVSCIALHGLGGVGKTAIAREYLYQHARQYEAVWWIRAGNSGTMMSDLSELGRALGIPVVELGHGLSTQLVTAVQQRLSRLSRWLLVLDDASDCRLVANVLPQLGNGDVMVTSRDPHWEQVASPLRVDGFKRPESVRFLAERTGSSDLEDLGRLAKALFDLPLALEQAASYMVETSLPVPEYLELFKKKHLALWQVERAPRDYMETVATTWSISIESATRDTQEAEYVLRHVSFLSPDEIPRQLLYCRRKTKPGSDEADWRIAVDAAIASLARYSLIYAMPRAVWIHGLVQQVTRDEHASQADDLGHLLENLNRFVGSGRERIHGEDAVHLAPHAMSAAKHGIDNSVRLPTISNLLAELAFGLGDCGQSQLMYDCRLLAMQAEKIHFGSESVQVCRTLRNLAVNLNEMGRVEEALERSNEAQGIARKRHGEGSEAFADCLRVHAIVLRDNGKLGASKASLEWALLIESRLHGRGSGKVAGVLKHLGRVQAALGELGAARTALEQSLRINEKRHGKKSEYVAPVLDALGPVLLELGNAEEAKKSHERSLRINEAVHGPKSRHVAASLSGLSAALLKLEKIKEARQHLERALEINERIHGTDSRYTAATLTRLGPVLLKLGDAEAAREALERALRINELVYGAEGGSVAATLTNLGPVLLKLGDAEAAREALERASQINELLYGNDSRYVAATLSELGPVLLTLGLAEEARDHLTRALRINEETFGRQSKHVADTLVALGKIFTAIGDEESARDSLARALEIEESIHGARRESRPGTIT